MGLPLTAHKQDGCVSLGGISQNASLPESCHPKNESLFRKMPQKLAYSLISQSYFLHRDAFSYYGSGFCQADMTLASTPVLFFLRQALSMLYWLSSNSEIPLLLPQVLGLKLYITTPSPSPAHLFVFE